MTLSPNVLHVILYFGKILKNDKKHATSHVLSTCMYVFQEIIEISADYHNMIEGVVVHVLDRATNTRTATTSITFFNNVNIYLTVCLSVCSVRLSVGRSVTVPSAWLSVYV